MTADADGLVLVFGTRPEIIKMAPVIHACERRGIPFQVIHTGQHYSETLDEVFFRQLELQPPDRHLGIGSDRHGKQTGAMLDAIEQELLDLAGDTVLVQGDTNTTVAGALAAAKLDVALGHIEAGLRSFDRAMPEEINRIVADHIADYLFAPTDRAAAILDDEGVPSRRTWVTGNTIVDAIDHNVRVAERESSILDRLDIVPNNFLLVTAHRPANVDDPSTFADLLDGIDRVSRELSIPAIYPIHPRAEQTIEDVSIEVPSSIQRIDPVGYFDCLALQQQARLILTDSGGIQEEACVLGVPCVTLRESTERPETVTVGANRLVGTDPAAILEGARRMVDRGTDWSNPFGDGDAAEQILDAIAGRPLTEVAG